MAPRIPQASAAAGASLRAAPVTICHCAMVRSSIVKYAKCPVGARLAGSNPWAPHSMRRRRRPNTTRRIHPTGRMMRLKNQDRSASGGPRQTNTGTHSCQRKKIRLPPRRHHQIDGPNLTPPCCTIATVPRDTALGLRTYPGSHEAEADCSTAAPIKWAFISSKAAAKRSCSCLAKPFSKKFKRRPTTPLRAPAQWRRR